MTGLVKEIDARRSSRALLEDTIDDEIVQRLITAAIYAPSCSNNQPWRFMVVTGEVALKKLHSSLTDGNYWAKKAPLIFVVATKATFDAKLSDNREYALYDCGLAAENLLLQATKEGLYAHPMAGFDPLIIKEAFDIPKDYIVINLIAVAYPGPLEGLSEKHILAEQSERNRKPQEEVVCHNKWVFE